jgi:type I restriction enzyme S subunit
MIETTPYPVVRLNELIDPSAPIQYGILQPGPVLDEGVLYVRPSEISDDGVIDLQNVRRTSPEIGAKYRRSIIKPNDILITIVGTLGRIAVVPPELDGANITQSSARIRPDHEKLSFRFLYWALKSPMLRHQYDRHRLGTGVPRLNIAHVRDLKIPLPPLAEQKRIAAILDKADAIRRKRQEAIALTEEFLRSAFLDMFGDPVTNPKGWSTVEIGTLVTDSQYGTAEKANTDGKGLPVLRMNNITAAGEIDLSKMKWCPIEPNETEKYTVRKDDLLFNRTNSPELVGKTAVWKGGNATHAYAGYLVRFRFDEQRVLPEYVSAFLNSGYGKRYLFVKAKPSNNMSNFSASLFRTIPIPVPTMALQQQYRLLRLSIRKTTEQMLSKKTETNNLFNALVQRAFRGEL